MTEIERLVTEGFISESFLQEEVRCDYTVSSKQKKMWAIQMDLARELLRVCEKHNLRIWGYAGTILGAVRHKGFIPWDDDMDFVMPRDDFDRLMSIIHEFQDPYCLESPYNKLETNYIPFARLINKNTFLNHNVGSTEIKTWISGIFIDIFPLDGVSSCKLILASRYKMIKNLDIILHAYVLNVNPHLFARLLHKVLHWPILKCTSFKIIHRMHRIAKRTKIADSENVGVYVSLVYKRDRYIYNKKDWQGTLWLPFESIQIPVPQGYENILRKIYGNYMQFPPIEKRGCWHNMVFDPEVPFASYNKQDQ